MNAIAPEQYRKALSAGDHSLNKRLTLDLIRQKKRPAVMCSNDAKSCYDRIVHSVASIAMQRLGVPKEPIMCRFTTIQNLEHRIQTIYGNLRIKFSGSLWTIPIQGVGQGNEAGPQIWAVLSTPILNMLQDKGYGAFFKAALSGSTLSFVGYAFVDNIRGSSGRYARIGEAWEGSIRATGGAIVPKKSHWYLIDFIWLQGDWRYATPEEAPAEVFVKDCDGVEKTLQCLPVSKARQTLGIRLAPDRNNLAEFGVLREKA
jgi:hypothetical protein